MEKLSSRKGIWGEEGEEEEKKVAEPWGRETLRSTAIEVGVEGWESRCDERSELQLESFRFVG